MIPKTNMVVILRQCYVSIAGSLQAMLEAKGCVSLIHDDNKWLCSQVNSETAAKYADGLCSLNLTYKSTSSHAYIRLSISLDLQSPKYLVYK